MKKFTYDNSKREEVTDMITDEAYDDPEFKRGTLLKFEKATIVITRVDRKNHRTWARHATLVQEKTGMSHYSHNLDTTDETQKEFGAPYCQDCEIPITEKANSKGKQVAMERADGRLEDGTEIE